MGEGHGCWNSSFHIHAGCQPIGARQGTPCSLGLAPNCKEAAYGCRRMLVLAMQLDNTVSLNTFCMAVDTDANPGVFSSKHKRPYCSPQICRGRLQLHIGVRSTSMLYRRYAVCAKDANVSQSSRTFGAGAWRCGIPITLLLLMKPSHSLHQRTGTAVKRGLFPEFLVPLGVA